MTAKKPSLSGPVHILPRNFQRAINANHTTKAAWGGITPLAKNEWICWVESAKLIETRERRIQRAQIELAEGKRRPCCWPGCLHRQKLSR